MTFNYKEELLDLDEEVLIHKKGLSKSKINIIKRQAHGEDYSSKRKKEVSNDRRSTRKFQRS